MSDPSQINVPIHMALTSDMNLGLKPSAPKSRSYRLSIPPINATTFQPGSQVIIELPTGRKGTWLDQSQTYLKFSVQCATTAATVQSNLGSSGVFIDNTAYSFIQRCDIYNSSNLLETINEYGQLGNLLIDTSLTQSDKAGLSAMIGSNPFTTSLVNITALSTNYGFPSLQIAGDRSGLNIATNTTLASSIPYTFSLPLLSGVIGVNASKMLPLGKLSSPIRAEFYLAQNDDAIYYGTAGAGAVWQLVNVELCACYVEIIDDEYNNIDNNENHYISTTTYRQASTSIPYSTAGEFTTLLPFRAASITALYARFRPYVNVVQGVNASAAYRKGTSINPNLGSYYFRVGSSIYPNKPVYLMSSTTGTGSEGYAELLKSFHALSSSIGNSAITYPMYNVAATSTFGWAAPSTRSSQALSNQSNQAFTIGLECQSFSNRNDTILSGISTLNSQIYFTGLVYTGLVAGDATLQYNYTADFFSQMDMILVIDENGVMSAKF